MANRVREFRQIKPVDYRTSILANQQAGKQFEAGVGSLQRALGDFSKRANVKIEDETKRNTQAIQSNLDRLQSLGQIKEAEESGEFADEALRGAYGERYDAEAAKQSFKAHKAKLTGEAISTASGAARELATESQDMNTGRQAMYQQLRQQGLDETEAAKASNAWVEGATGIKSQIAQTQSDNYNTAWDNLLKATSTGVDTGEAIEASGQNLKPEQKRKFLAEANEFIERKSKLSTDDQLELSTMQARDQMAIERIKNEANAAIAVEVAALENTPKPISDVTANEFENVADVGSHVLEKFQKEIESPLTAGVFNAIFQIPFSGVTTGSKALEKINERYGNLVTTDKLSRKDIAAVLWESYKETLSKHGTLGAPGVQLEALDAAVKQKITALADRRDKESRISTARAKANTRVESLREQGLNRIYQFTKGTHKANIMGKQGPSFGALDTSTPKITPASTAADEVNEVTGVPVPDQDVPAPPPEEEIVKEVEKLKGKKGLDFQGSKLKKQLDKIETLVPAQFKDSPEAKELINIAEGSHRVNTLTDMLKRDPNNKSLKDKLVKAKKAVKKKPSAKEILTKIREREEESLSPWNRTLAQQRRKLKS